MVDHSGEAAKVGLKMPNTNLLIFGNPKGGTPLMLASSTVAIDLPLKILVAEDAQGKVWISYNSPEYLKERRLRGLVQKAFVPRLIENLGQRIQVLADELLSRVQSQGRMDLIHDYALQIPTTIIAEMLGVPQKDRLKFHIVTKAEQAKHLASQSANSWRGVQEAAPVGMCAD